MRFAAIVFALILCLAPLTRAQAEVIPDFSSETLLGELLQSEMTEKVKFRNVHCEADFLKRATEPYAKIAEI
jgi:hypothetical protein